MLLGLIVCLIGGTISWDDGYISIISQSAEYDEEWADALIDSIVNQDIQIFEFMRPELKGQYIKWQAKVGPFLSVPHKGKQLGSWQLLPLIDEFYEIIQKYPHKKWFVIVDAYSNIRLTKLINFLSLHNAENPLFFGHGVFDEFVTDRHNYTGIEEEFDYFYYPEPSAGIVLSSKLVVAMYNILQSKRANIPKINMDPGFELAKFVYLYTDAVRIRSESDLFCIFDDGKSCAVYYTVPLYDCPYKLQFPEEAFAYIKSFSDYHTTRLNFVYYTWEWIFAELKSSEIVSDIKDAEYRTVASPIPNTPIGHCSKTLQMLKDFLKKGTNHRWLLITDDDTLINPAALITPLACYDYKKPFIFGDRYGYNTEAKKSFDYPAGGAGIVLTRSAVKKIVEYCKCPADDAADDKFIGACAQNTHIPIIHLPSFHYWSPNDYPIEYLDKIQAISFHNFTNIDPLDVHRTFLDRRIHVNTADFEPGHRDPINWDSFKMDMTDLPPELSFWKDFWSERSFAYDKEEESSRHETNIPNRPRFIAQINEDALNLNNQTTKKRRQTHRNDEL